MKSLKDILLTEKELPDYYRLLGLDKKDCPEWPRHVEVDGKTVDIAVSQNQGDHKILVNRPELQDSHIFTGQVEAAARERMAEARDLGLDDILDNFIYATAAGTLGNPVRKIIYDAGLNPNHQYAGDPNAAFTNDDNCVGAYIRARQRILERELERNELPQEKRPNWPARGGAAQSR